MIEKQKPNQGSGDHRNAALDELAGKYLQLKKDPNTLFCIHFKAKGEEKSNQFMVVARNPEDTQAPYRLHIGLVPTKSLGLTRGGQTSIIFPKNRLSVATVGFTEDYQPRKVAVYQDFGNFTVNQTVECPLPVLQRQFGKTAEAVLAQRSSPIDPQAIKVLNGFLGKRR